MTLPEIGPTWRSRILIAAGVVASAVGALAPSISTIERVVAPIPVVVLMAITFGLVSLFLKFAARVGSWVFVPLAYFTFYANLAGVLLVIVAGPTLWGTYATADAAGALPLAHQCAVAIAAAVAVLRVLEDLSEQP